MPSLFTLSTTESIQKKRTVKTTWPSKKTSPSHPFPPPPPPLSPQRQRLIDTEQCCSCSRFSTCSARSKNCECQQNNRKCTTCRPHHHCTNKLSTNIPYTPFPHQLPPLDTSLHTTSTITPPQTQIANPYLLPSTIPHISHSPPPQLHPNHQSHHHQNIAIVPTLTLPIHHHHLHQYLTTNHHHTIHLHMPSPSLRIQ